MKELVGSPLRLEEGARYLARVYVDFPKLFVSTGAVREKLEELGFTDVGVSFDVPASWPEPAPPKPSSGFYAYASGRWAKPTTTLERPDEIARAWLDDAAGVAVAKTPPPAPKGPAPTASDGPFVTALKGVAVATAIDLAGEIVDDLLK